MLGLGRPRLSSPTSRADGSPSQVVSLLRDRSEAVEQVQLPPREIGDHDAGWIPHNGATLSKTMTATISDVAKGAGVSTATVSRVLSGSPRVLPETRERVLAVMDELDYRPSAVARSLRKKSTAVIGLIVTDVTNPFYPEVVRGVEDEARQQGRSVLLCNAAEDPEREQSYLEVLLERRVDAVIVASNGFTRRQAEELRNLPIPAVLLNVIPVNARIPAVLSDNRAGGRIAAEHLVECGYPKFAHIAGPLDLDGKSERLNGVVDVLGESELLVVDGDGHLEGGANAMREIIQQMTPPFGVAAHNDLSAIGALSVLRDIGWDVPGQVGVVGFDDIALSGFVTPALTTVSQDKYGMGATAARTVDQLLAKQQVAATTIHPVKLVARGSTGRRAT